MFETKEQAIETIVNAFPYPKQIKDWDLTTEKDAVIFTWRENRFRMCLKYGRVEEVGDGVLIGSDIAILATHIIKIANLNLQLAK